MANDDDEFRTWLLKQPWDENVYIERLREAGALRNVADELRERVGFRSFLTIRERVLSQPPQARRAPRKPSLASRLKAAQRAGAKDVDVRPDGTVTAAFGETAKSNSDANPNPWDEVLKNAAH
jgi:hypothetical protein